MTIWATRLLWGVAGALAATLLVVLGVRLVDNSADDFAPAPVLVANRVIQAGTSGTTVTDKQMFTETALPRKELLENAIADPMFLIGRTASRDVLPGEQLTAYSFADISP